MKVKRLMGPQFNVAFTQDNKRGEERFDVSVVKEEELKQLEKFFELPLHQQIEQMTKAIRKYMKENKLEYPQGIFLAQTLKALDIAHDLAFAQFVTGLELTEVYDARN